MDADLNFKLNLQVVTLSVLKKHIFEILFLAIFKITKEICYFQ